MIRDRKELDYYLECDRVALGEKRRKPSLFGNEIWKFQIYMRKLDFSNHSGGYNVSEAVLPFQISPTIH